MPTRYKLHQLVFLPPRFSTNVRPSIRPSPATLSPHGGRSRDESLVDLVDGSMWVMIIGPKGSKGTKIFHGTGRLGYFPRDPGSPCQMMIGVYNHLVRKGFRFHYHSQKVIGSLGFMCVLTKISVCKYIIIKYYHLYHLERIDGDRHSH